MFKYYNTNFFDKRDFSELVKQLRVLNSNNNLIKNKITDNENNFDLQLKFYGTLNCDNYINKLKNMMSLDLIKKENEIIKILSKYCLKNKIYCKKYFVNILKLIFKISEILRIKINQNEVTINLKKNNIYRSSYKFCNFKHQCSFNYTKNNKKCYQDHYVHNMVSFDIQILLNYIDKKFKNDTIQNFKEVLKSINTLSFVINHMETELQNKCIYEEKNLWEQYHCINTKN